MTPENLATQVGISMSRTRHQKLAGLAEYITVEHRNTIKDGFPERLHGTADAVFLDLPLPAPVVASAAKCLRPNGVLCSFSPCIEQVLGTSEEMAKLGMLHVRTFEFLLRLYDVGLYPVNQLPPLQPAKGVDEQQELTEGGGVDEDQDLEEKPALPAKRKAGDKQEHKGEEKQKRKGEAGKLFQPYCTKRTVVARPTMAAKGHTGFLTFCRTQPS